MRRCGRGMQVMALSGLTALAGAGMTSENVAERYGITRQQQDELAARSHNRAAAAQSSGRFADEIVPVKTTWKDPKTVREASPPPCLARTCCRQLWGGMQPGPRPPGSGYICMSEGQARSALVRGAQRGCSGPWRRTMRLRQACRIPKGGGRHAQGEEKQIVVDKDDGIREGMTASALAKLRPAFKKSGTTTAGNSSQVRGRRAASGAAMPHPHTCRAACARAPCG